MPASTPISDYSALNESLLDLGGTPGNISTPNNTSTPNNKSVRSNTSVPGNIGGLIPKTYKLPVELVEKIERIAYWRREKIQDIVAAALEAYIANAVEEELQPHK